MARLDHIPARLVLVLLVTALPPPVPLAGQSLRLNEVLYDAEGPDTDREFVELILLDGTAIALRGVALESGNGARPDDWRRVWLGSAADTIHPGDHFVVGGALLEPPPDVVARLGLQNGPDACRLVVSGRVVDLLGWGAHAWSGYAEGDPAPGGSPGSSLARIPDGSDTDRNRIDWQPLSAPSPGFPNRAPPAFRLLARGHHSTGVAPHDLHLDWRIEAHDDPLPPLLRLEPCANMHPGVPGLLIDTGGETAEGTLRFPAQPPGPLMLCVEAVAGETRDTLHVAARAGPGPLRITEIMARPDPGAPEWIEVANTGPDTLLLAGYTITDARLDPFPLTGADDPATRATPLAPGGVLVIAAAPVPETAGPLLVLDRWPILNDGGDRVRLVDGAGRTTDDVAYEADWLQRGASLVRLALDLPSEERRTWVTEPGGSPGRFERRRRETARGFVTVESPATGGSPWLLRLRAPLRTGRLTIHRLDGRRVLEIEGAALRGRTRVVWERRDTSGVPLAPGVYVVSITGTAWEDATPIASRATLVLGPR